MLLYLRSDLMNVWFSHWGIGMCHQGILVLLQNKKKGSSIALMKLLFYVVAILKEA